MTILVTRTLYTPVNNVTYVILPTLLYLTQIGLSCILYNYLRHAIHGRVTSGVNIANMQMAAIFFLDSKVWLMNDVVWQHKYF